MTGPKTEAYWIGKGYQFMELSSCSGCGAPVSVWTKNNQLIPLDAQTLEPHYSECPAAQRLRQEQKLKDGVI